MFYGRSAEIAAIESLLIEAAAGRAGIVVVRGEAGIGKSALLAQIAAKATAADGSPGFRVLRASGTEAESELPFAGLHLLLGRQRLDGLPQAQAEALRAALDTGEGRGNRFLVGAATLTLLAELAEEQPLLCLVDDAQWLDRASLDALLFAIRRLDAERVAVVLAVRDDRLPELQQLDATELVLTGLDENDARALLDARHRDLPAATARWVVRESQGNPLALHILPTVRLPEQMYASPYRRTDAPHRIECAFAEQLAALPRTTRDLVLVAAADGSGEAAVIRAAAARFEATDDDLAAAEQAGLLTLDGARILFRHPLIRAAAYHDATPAHRREAHLALADALGATAPRTSHPHYLPAGWGAVAAPETASPVTLDEVRRAWHLAAAATGPDETAATALEHAACHARARGGLAEVVAAYERSAELSVEPSDRGRREAAAAQAAADAGNLDRAAELAQRALVTMPDAPVLAWLVALQAAIAREQDRPRVAYRTLTTAAAASAGSDPETAGYLLFQAAESAWSAGDLATVGQTAAQAERLGLPGAERIRALADLVGALNMEPGSQHRGVTALRTLVRDVAPDRFADRAQLVHWHLLLGEVATVRDLAAALEEDCRRDGALGVLGRALWLRARAEILLGHFSRATAAATEGLRLAADTGHRVVAINQATTLAHLAALRGDEATCRQLTAEPLARGIAPGTVHAETALAVLDLGLGRPEATFDRLSTMLSGANRHGATASLPDLIEAAHRIDRPDAARDALAAYENWAEHVGHAWARAIARRCRALLTPGAAAAQHFDAALETHYTSSEYAFDRARTELLYGEWLRREQRRADARRHLRAAVETFEHLDARPWADRARNELRATGETLAAKTDANPLNHLTPQELQTVQLAAEGLSNKEIGARLFLSPRTVGYHLSNAYPKLGITSRRELGRFDDLTRH
ncbi:AAA family ATPase [Nocardia sp. NPDC050406]|uniref:helix-turn-helix transcriptional regulator n=1 Tax=Nocardia sp. NPDC050406 TaxID=3364318 RepID=UPI0037BD4388